MCETLDELLSRHLDRVLKTRRHRRWLNRNNPAPWSDELQFTRGRPYDGAIVNEDGELVIPNT